MSEYANNRAFSDKCLPAIRRAVGDALGCTTSIPPEYEDTQRNTDLIVLGAGVARVACRIRRPGFADKYGNEFTIRFKTPHGRTEFAKIIEGWGNYFFYGHMNEDGESLASWALCDLSVFRGWLWGQLYIRGGMWLDSRVKHNGDRSSTFVYFRFDELPPAFVVARQESAALMASA